MTPEEKIAELQKQLEAAQAREAAAQAEKSASQAREAAAQAREAAAQARETIRIFLFFSASYTTLRDRLKAHKRTRDALDVSSHSAFSAAGEWTNPLADLQAAAKAGGVLLPDVSAIDAAFGKLYDKQFVKDLKALAAVETKVLSEKGHVHPFGNRFLEAALAAVPTMTPPLHCYYESTSSTSSSDDSTGTLGRKPDAAGYRHVVAGFNDCSQNDVVLPVEYKEHIVKSDGSVHPDAQEAVVEVEQDYAYTLPHAWTGAPIPYGLGVVSDGVHWRLTRSQLLSLDRITPVASNAYDLREKSEAHTVFTLVVYAAAVVASGTYCYKSPLWTTPLLPDNTRITGAVAVMRASMLFRFERAAPSSDAVIVKVAKLTADGEDRARFDREHAVWAPGTLSRAALNHDNIVQCIGRDLFGMPALLFPDEHGIAVEYLCYCVGDARRTAIAKKVYKDISAALTFMHAAEFAHVDVQVRCGCECLLAFDLTVLCALQPANIIIANDGEGVAKLIDCESVSAFELAPPSTRRTVVARPRFSPVDFEQRAISADTDNESLMFVLAWILNVESFGNPSTEHDHEQGLAATYTKRKEKILKRAATLDKFVERRLK
jgi:hypothetical protein